MYYLEKSGNSKKNQKIENQHGVMICNVLPRKKYHTWHTNSLEKNSSQIVASSRTSLGFLPN
jgi:hypothetical protein